jgi:outer membrane protein
MRNLILLTILMLFVVGLSAQCKVAHVDIPKIYDNVPEVKAVKDSLAVKQDLLEAKGAAMLDEYNTLRANYEKRRTNMSEADRTKKEAELADKEQQIMAFRENGQSMLEQTSKRMLKPVKERVEKAISDVAAEQGYDYVLDSTEDVIRFANPTLDITNLVLKKMGITPKP